MESCTNARKRRSSLRSPVSPQRSIVSSRSATCAPTVPSGCPRRGLPQASPSCSTGSSSRARSRSVSAATLVDPFRNPEIALAGEDHPGLVAALADRDEVRPVLFDPGLVVDQNQKEVARRPVGAHLGQSGAGGLLHGLALPAAVGGRGIRKGGIGGAHVLLPVAGLPSIARTYPEEPEDERDQEDHAEDDQDDCQCGHDGRSLGRPLERRRPPRGRPFAEDKSAATYSPRAARPKYHRR